MARTPSQWYASARESFWFLPAVMVVAAVVLAEAATGADRLLDTSRLGRHSIFALGVDGSRGLLQIIGGSTLSVAAMAFSITISVIATASSAYGPRLVRNFMADRSNQFVLAVFVSSFVYSLVVLRSVNGANEQYQREAFVPYIAVYLAIVIAVLNVVALVYFIHHIADSIQISTLVERVRNDLVRVAERHYPAPEDEERVAAEPLRGDLPTVTADRSGYVTDVDVNALVKAARKHDTVVEVLPMVGDHVLAGEPLARVTQTDDDLTNTIGSSVTVDDARTPHQDVRRALHHLLEIADRALSPGTNDPFTAVNAIEELGPGLVVIARCRELPTGHVDDDGSVRLVLRRPQPDDLVDEVFDDLRAHGSSDMRVIRPTIALAARVAAAGPTELGTRAWRHVELMVDAFERSGADPFDVERMRREVSLAQR
ncbi:DUF2254 domain-containing protein [Aestuariimicrobium ganziense]|uniref:DUF2254 domain-containing protein n=1 Tax=Aestuariimicrobium ganziense TaxID=2773677 RepID=UPI001944B71A|nr:DUF2254 domain-containing protein [Aestuariimicrobium ganziense]